MAKKKKDVSRWTRGWQTRREKLKAAAAVNDLVNDAKTLKARSIESPLTLNPRNALTASVEWVHGKALGPMCSENGILGATPDDIVERIMAAARKRNGRAAVDEIISERMRQQRIDAVNDSARAADQFQRATLEHYRDDVICGLIAEFEASRGRSGAGVWRISHRFWSHVINALKQAGYSALGRAQGSQEPRG